MRRVLFLAYYFPPLGGAGVQRSVKFVRYLPEHGYEAVVVTAPAAERLDWAPPDDSLGRGVLPQTAVWRTAGPAPGRRTGWRARAERWLRLQPPFSKWWVDAAIEAGRKAVGDTTVDLVYGSMSPFETGDAAVALARSLGVPAVLDLRDPWALDEWLVYPTIVHRRLELRRMGRTLAAADAIVMNTPEAAAQVRRHFRALRSKAIATIPNGFDAADFAGEPAQRDDGSFRIVHAGYVHAGASRDRRAMRARERLGGAVRGLNVVTRSHVVLLQALLRLLETRPDVRGRIEVHLAGSLTDFDRAVPGFELVRERGYLPHAETVELLRSADLLFLPMHDLPRGTRARIVPGKTYEYLAARRPILGAVPDGDARDLLARAGASVVRPDDVEGMARALGEHVDRFLTGAVAPAPPEELLLPYERRRLTAQLAAVFDEAVAS